MPSAGACRRCLPGHRPLPCLCVAYAAGRPACPAAAEVGWDGTLEELQALVASLELAVAFSKDLTQCMPVITQVGCWCMAGQGQQEGCPVQSQALGRLPA